MIRLEAASPVLPPGLRELLDDLGSGETGFGGTTVPTGETTIEDFVQQCCDMTDPSTLQSGLVPQTTFWALDADGTVVGMVRLRHYLNDKLRLQGGHIGYFIRRDQRSKGYAKEALRLALIELRKLGETRALLTVDLRNIPSIRVIERNGGHLESTVTDPDTGRSHRRYWIDLEP
ncbi:MAG: GNAT family N-acetyltransferase [Candidatus Hydrogenedentes bacterium]|nr:GNAT family N-acetyltransferase [Candidatus Hydrogenedentota bacterium]